ILMRGCSEWSTANVSLARARRYGRPSALNSWRDQPCHDFWCGWLVSQRGMWAHAIVMLAPPLDDDLRLAERREDFAVEQLVAQAPIEALDIAVLPRATAFDVSRSRPDRADPALHGVGDELRPLLRADVGRHTAQSERIGQRLDHIDRVQLARHLDGQT